MNNIVYYAPDCIAEAVELLDAHDTLRVLAGGTDLLVKWKKSRYFDMNLMDIRNIPELREIRFSGNCLFVGAAVSMNDVNESRDILESYPILAEAAGSVGSVQIRNMATIGGNICNAAPSADTALPLIVYKAEVIVISKSGERRMPIEDFFVGPGETVLRPGEMLKGLCIPAHPNLAAGHFIKHGRRVGMDLATVGVGMFLTIDETGTVKDLRVALGAVGPTPILVKGLASIIGDNIKTDGIRERLAAQALAEACPISDVRGSRQYREAMIYRNVADCFTEVINKLNKSNMMNTYEN